MRLRHPNPGDTGALLVLARAMHAESWYRDFDFNEETVANLLSTCQSNDDLLALVVVDVNDLICGFFCGATTQHFFGLDKYACDLALYVVPEHRGSFAAVRLIRAYEAWCRIKGVREVHIGASTGINSERTVKFYEKLGFGNPVMGLRKKCVSPF